MYTRAMTFALLVVVFAGCHPGTWVVKDPGHKDSGVRFYRPKPYLFISPHEGKDQVLSDEMVDIQLEMLPDYSEEYSLHIRSGLGTNDTSFTLDQGWNLTELNVNIDSNFDENIGAITEGIARFVPTDGGSDVPGTGQGRRTVRALNVPMGYYESVISCGPDGRKRMYGWRYVGFSPYAGCPVETGGVECQDCSSTVLYGLVFHDGAMVFKPLHGEAQILDTTRTPHSSIDRAQNRFQAAVAHIVPVVLTSQNINGVSSADVTVRMPDETSDRVIVNVSMDQNQLDDFRGANVSQYEIAEAIAASYEANYGDQLAFGFGTILRDN